MHSSPPSAPVGLRDTVYLLGTIQTRADVNRVPLPAQLDIKH